MYAFWQDTLYQDRTEYFMLNQSYFQQTGFSMNGISAKLFILPSTRMFTFSKDSFFRTFLSSLQLIFGGLCSTFVHHSINERLRDKTNKIVCMSSEDSDQPGHPPSLISLRCPREESLGPWLPIKRTAKTDQTGQVPRLIQVFAGRVILLVLWCGGSNYIF